MYTFLDNHDQTRVASNVSNPAHLGTLYTLLFTLPGILSVYYGSEWGVKGIKEKFSDTDIRPYIDIENRFLYSTWLTGHISKLAHIRQGEKALKYGNYRQIYLDYQRPFVFERSIENERIYVAVNIADNDAVIDLSAHCKGSFLDLLLEEHIADTRHIQVKAHSARILKEDTK